MCVCLCNQNIPKRITTSKKDKNQQEKSKDNTKGQRGAEGAEDVVANLNRNAAAAVASMAVGRGLEARGGGGMLNQDTGESYLKSVEFNRNILRDSVGGGGTGHKGAMAEDWKDIGSTSKPTTTTEKYPMQWGYQVLPTLYSIYQKVLVLANRRTIYLLLLLSMSWFSECISVNCMEEIRGKSRE